MGLPRRRRLVAVVGAMVAASLILPPSGLHGATPSLEASIDAGDRYLVRFASEAEAEGLSGDLARLTTLEALGDSGLEIDNVLVNVFAGAVIAGAAEDVERLRDDPRISAIEPDGVASYHVLDPDRASSINETPAVSADLLGTQTAPPWGLDRMDQRALPLSNSYTYASAGSGVTVYVVDSGVDPDHVDFGTRLEPGFDALSGTDGRFDCNGHGTHVAGTIAGSTYGMAKGAQIVPVRIGGCSGSLRYSDMLTGLDWMIDHHRGRGGTAIANLSLGGEISSLVDEAVAEALDAGILVVVAAGNGGSDGIGDNACGLSPGGSSSVITVGATDRFDTMPSWSNFGRCVDLLAPGDEIVSASYLNAFGSRTMTGTSMSAPHVSGAAAVLVGANPGLSARQAMAALLESATRGIVSGLVGDTPNRLAYLDPIATPIPLDPPNDDVAQASVLTPGPDVTVAGSTLLATGEVGEPVHAGVGGRRSIWWSLTAPETATVTLSTEGSDYDTVLAVYTGTDTRSLVEVVSDDDIVDGDVVTTRVSFTAMASTTYLIAVDGWEGEIGRVTLTLTSSWDEAVPEPEPETPNPPPSTGATLMTTRTPVRILDTRTTGTLITTTPTRLRITGRNGVPTTGVAAVALNVTVTQPQGPGYVTVYPCGTPPEASNLNYATNQTIPNAVLAPLSTQGDLCLTASAPTHLIIDLSAWFAR